jgi:hypothetical protein
MKLKSKSTETAVCLCLYRNCILETKVDSAFHQFTKIGIKT